VPFNENWRSRRRSPVAARVTHAPNHAAAALGRAIVLARALKWREEWQAEMAARRAKANGGAAKHKAAPSARQNGSAEFANAVARNEFGRFYWSETLQASPIKRE
jgi:hypothetical protein